MAELKKPVTIKCMGCGKLIKVAKLSTNGPDPEGIVFDMIRKGLKEKALCPDCLGRYNYLSSVGRSDEFHFNPEDVNA